MARCRLESKNQKEPVSSDSEPLVRFETLLRKSFFTPVAGEMKWTEYWRQYFGIICSRISKVGDWCFSLAGVQVGG